MSVIGIEGNQGSMSRVLAMPVDGILRKVHGGQLNPEGYYLYRTLNSMYRIVLIANDYDQKRLVTWLDKEGVFGYDDIIFPMTLAARWAIDTYWECVINILRQRGYNLSMVVVNGPEEAREVLNASVPVLLFGQPAYGLPDWLPGSKRGAESWDDLVDKVETERAAKMADKRTEAPLE